ncbi:MAG: nucleoside triphosphate pyrophosphohydrolase [Candidatus Cloacimonetes bacterium]|nr:nucleoside triphosphate pyrophosphohydrolase [Candidatus Cloacimonadota bacterium]
MKEFDRLIDIVARLRDPQDGCPWDLKQTHRSLVPNFIEELYEVIEAIQSGDDDHLCEELGDLTLHIVMQVRIARERGAFVMSEALNRICDKLVRRHPHIFGDTQAGSAADVKLNWERIKLREKAAQRKSILEGIPRSMPALIVAQRMQEKAAAANFDWPGPDNVMLKLREEIEEFEYARRHESPERVEDELGDLLFTLVNLARKLDIDAEATLKRGADKFERRFKAVEESYRARGLDMADHSLEQLDKVWDEVKEEE